MNLIENIKTNYFEVIIKNYLKLMIWKKSDDNFTLNHNILEEIKLDLLK